MKKKLTDKELEEKMRTAAEEGRIELASQDKLERVEDLAYEFVDKCLGFDECLITDESSVHDFIMDEDELLGVIERTREIYDVDITDKIDDHIVDIAEYIMIKREENNSGIQ